MESVSGTYFCRLLYSTQEAVSTLYCYSPRSLGLQQVPNVKLSYPGTMEDDGMVGFHHFAAACTRSLLIRL